MVARVCGTNPFPLPFNDLEGKTGVKKILETWILNFPRNAYKYSLPSGGFSNCDDCFPASH